MKKIIPVFYAEYGRYITRFRMIPYYIDCLIPVYRRLLVTLYEEARDKNVKSARIVGICTGKYHPHGDCYDPLVELVRNGFGIPQGNWGSPGYNEAPASAMRYTETHLAPWLKNFAFEYHDSVPRIPLELDPEPLYLPAPVPLGLIGTGVGLGVAFHKTVIPKYKINDLIDRLSWLLTNNVLNHDTMEYNYPDNDNGPIIKPNTLDCALKEEKVGEDFLNILKTGKGNVYYVPNVRISKKEIIVLGQAPLSSFNKIKKHLIEKKLTEIEPPNDLSKKSIEISIRTRRGIDPAKYAPIFWRKYLIKKINFNIIVCDDDGQAKLMGIDQLLIIGYEYWKFAILNSHINQLKKLNKKLFEYTIIPIIKNIIETTHPNSKKAIVGQFTKLNIQQEIKTSYFDIETGWVEETHKITENDINAVCDSRSISQLVESKDIRKKIESDIKIEVNIINNIDEFVFAKLESYKG